MFVFYSDNGRARAQSKRKHSSSLSLLLPSSITAATRKTINNNNVDYNYTKLQCIGVIYIVWMYVCYY